MPFRLSPQSATYRASLGFGSGLGFSRTRSRTRPGSTLVELLIYAAIFIIILTAVINLMIFLLTIRAKTDRKVDVAQTVRYALERVQSAAVGSRQIVAADRGFLALLSGSSAVTRFYVESGRIYVTRTSGTGTAITPQTVWVTSLLFDAYPGPALHVTLEAEDWNPVPTETVSVSTAFSLRTR